MWVLFGGGLFTMFAYEGCRGWLAVIVEGGGSATVVFISSVADFWRSLAESVKEWMCGIAEVRE